MDDIKEFINEQEESFHKLEREEVENSPEYKDWQDVRDLVANLKIVLTDVSQDQINTVLKGLEGEKKSLIDKFNLSFGSFPNTHPLKTEIRQLLEFLKVLPEKDLSAIVE